MADAPGKALGPELFEFLSELKLNNDRDWFNANKKRYERDVKAAVQGFIVAFSGPCHARISEHLVCDPRKSMFRIYRDVRFSKDKSPYKTHAAAQFRHVAGKDVHAPGLYLHLDPDEVFAGAGMWHPDSTSLKAIRERIAEHPDEWRGVLDSPGFKADWRLAGASLKRGPKGFDKDHPLIEDLKRKDFIAVTDLSVDEVLADDFVEVFTARCEGAKPLMSFLAKAIGAAW